MHITLLTHFQFWVLIKVAPYNLGLDSDSFGVQSFHIGAISTAAHLSSSHGSAGTSPVAGVYLGVNNLGFSQLVAVQWLGLPRHALGPVAPFVVPGRIVLEPPHLGSQ